MTDCNHICQITTLHARLDSRIFEKQCKSLAVSGFRVTLIVNDGLGDEESCGVNVKDLGGVKGGRLSRMLLGPPKAFLAAMRTKARICHLHDPELIPVGLLLALCGRKVVYDAHENLPNDMRNKPWIPTALQGVVGRAAAACEWVMARLGAACIGATPTISDRLRGYGARSVTVRNYPTLPATSTTRERVDNEKFVLCFAGAISSNRGAREMVEATARAGCRLILIGRFHEPHLQSELQQSAAWDCVDYRGFQKRDSVESGYRESDAGFLLFHPNINHADALPIKLFEYMQFSLPVIASDFPLWRTLIVEPDVGILVDPLDVDLITEAIVALRDNRELARSLGERGRLAVQNEFNWESEFRTLKSLYEELGAVSEGRPN